MSAIASRSGASRTVVALTVAGWLTILGITLPAAMSSDAVQSPAIEIEGTPDKAYPG